MKSKILITLFFVLFPLASNATFKEAAKLYEKEQYQAAFNEFYELAQIGHKSSQFNVGIMYLEGKGVKQDLAKAYAWVKLSDEKANKEQQTLEEIQGYFPKPEMMEKAQKEFELIASKYSEEAIALAYKPVITDDVDEVSSPVAIEQKTPAYPVRAQIRGYTGWVLFDFNLSKNGYPTDIRTLDSFPRGLFVKASLKAVKKWKFEALDSDRRYKYKMEFKLGDRKNDYTAKYDNLVEIKEAAIDGDPSSQYLHARYGGYNTEENDPFSAASWYYEAARNGVLNAQYELAERLIDGNGCEVDPEKAVNWLKTSAKNDFALSQFKLAKLAYLNGDDEKGLLWLKKALKNNVDEPSIDSEMISYDLVDYIYKNKVESIPPENILRQLQSIDEDNIINPVNYYQFYSYTYEGLGDFEEALDYQEEAIEELEDLGEEKIPQEMLDNLTYLEAKVG